MGILFPQQIEKEEIGMTKIIVPVVTLLVTVSTGTAFGVMLKKVTPIFATVRN